MKRMMLTLMATLSFSYVMAQAEMDFPFQGGVKVMNDYFTKSIAATDLMKQRAASGIVVMKFTSDTKGSIIKMVVYYADDASLVEPVIAALKNTDGKWIIPNKEKSYDFLIPFSINVDAPNNKASKAMLAFYNTRQPITAADQIPLYLVSLLPTVQIKYTYTPPAAAPKTEMPAKPVADIKPPAVTRPTAAKSVKAKKG